MKCTEQFPSPCGVYVSFRKNTCFFTLSRNGFRPLAGFMFLFNLKYVCIQVVLRPSFRPLAGFMFLFRRMKNGKMYRTGFRPLAGFMFLFM